MSDSKPFTLHDLAKRKGAERRLSCLTAYDASFARLLDSVGVDLVLVGDSLGNVLQGHRNTMPVTMDDMVYHSRCVVRGLRRALQISDMPFMSYSEPRQALANAARLMAEGGASMVKLEGAGPILEVIRHLSAHQVPVCGHLGLTPQSVHKLGGFRVQGREEGAAERLFADAVAVQEAGAELLVLELVPSPLAARITAKLTIPTIGIGAGPHCDGQVLVLHDAIGIPGPFRPRFVKDFVAEAGSLEAGLRAFVDQVADGTFPGPEHSFES